MNQNINNKIKSTNNQRNNIKLDQHIIMAQR